ncbi:MAG: Tim44/TimA family putative adaptor protein [Bradyrhizobiaceae bacterium]|nr:Tim44/TimA family putative adaptor protein [Bradyrhizobiaceae bacterium]
MSQEVDGSGLIWLIWATWVYWWVYRWLHYLSSLERHEKERRERAGRKPAINANATPPLPEARAPKNLEAIVSEILRRDGASTLNDFLANALTAYETIVAAFNSGDRDTLRSLVSPEVYDAFSDAIAAREAQGKNMETVFSQLERPKIVGGLIDGTHMEISIRFAGESFKLSGNAGDLAAGGRTDRCRTVDIWTFERMLSARESAWRVVATEAGVG